MKTIVSRIEALTRERGYLYTLALILLRDLFLLPEEIADINPREHLNIQELTLLVGLFVKHAVDLTVPTEGESAKRFELTYQMFEELHKKYHEPFLEQINRLVSHGRGDGTPQENYRKIFGQGVTMAEPIFYSASGAYDFQYQEFAVKKYKNDTPWLRKQVGVDIAEMANIARKLKTLHERKFNDLFQASRPNFAEFCTAGLSVFCFGESDLSEFSPRAVRRFLEVFSLAPAATNAALELPGQYNEAQSRPIIRLGDGRWFLPIAFNLSEAIYESPFYWMNRDREYKDAALRHRGDFAEEVTAELLASTCGASKVYRNVQIIERKGQAITDIDVLAIVGNKAVIAQVKSKRLTEVAKRGDEKKLVADFELAVQEAYEQGLLSRTVLRNGKNKLFVEGAELQLTEPIDEAYILCVTVDSYPAVTHQVDVYLRKQANDPTPIALSILDLDVLTFYLRDPFEFAYYLRQRVALNHYFKADSEMSLLGYHLGHKLFRGEGTTKILDGSFAQLIDANFQVVRGSVPRTDAADKLRSTWRNEDFQTLIDQVKATREPKFTDAIFFLYDLSGQGADDLIKALRLTKGKTQADQQPHDMRLPMAETRSGITVLCEPSSPSILREKLLWLSEVAKYKSNADVWLGLGCLATSPRLVDVIVFANYERRYDPELESQAAQLRGKPMTAEGRKIGRNEPCPCKSGKKFKRCCGR